MRTPSTLALLRALAGALLCAFIAWSPASQAQDADQARKLFESCAQLLDSGSPCKALKLCKQAESLHSTTAIKKLTRKAREACDAKSGGGSSSSSSSRDKDEDGVADKNDSCPDQAEDIDGFQDEDGCPDPDNDGDTIADVDDRCPNKPEDVDGFKDDDGCPEADNDGDGFADIDDRCPKDAEDVDGYQDDDGCPDLDNDNDGIADAQDQCPDVREDIDGFADSDGCPEEDNDNDGLADAEDGCPSEAEDPDGFEDGDGCPDPDNDEDGIADADDLCPTAAEDADGVQDEDGCPEENALDTAVPGYIVLGAGGAFGVASLALHLVAEGKRTEITDARDSDGTISGMSQREAQVLEDDANTFDTVAAISIGVGGGLIATGAVLILLEVLDEPEIAPSVQSYFDGERVWLGVGGRF